MTAAKRQRPPLAVLKEINHLVTLLAPHGCRDFSFTYDDEEAVPQLIIRIKNVRDPNTTDPAVQAKELDLKQRLQGAVAARYVTPGVDAILAAAYDGADLCIVVADPEGQLKRIRDADERRKGPAEGYT
jgi:hypothetical protein